MRRMPSSEKRIRQRLAMNVRRLRQERALTLEEASDRAGMYLRHFQKIEAGDVNATLHTLDRLAEGFGVDVTELFAQNQNS